MYIDVETAYDLICIIKNQYFTKFIRDDLVGQKNVGHLNRLEFCSWNIFRDISVQAENGH